MSALQRISDALRDANPIVRKELLAALRTPLYVRAVVVSLVFVGTVVALSAASIADGREPWEGGKTLFQVFFGVTFFVMVLVGTTFGATSIVQEREARTLDALTLSALGPRRVARGKLAAVFLSTAFIPVLALPLLGVVTVFGGVTAGHLAVATVYALVFGAVGAAFGVAVSASVSTTRAAVTVTAPPVALATLIGGSVLTAVGEQYARSHALSIRGPLFFADAYFALPLDRSYLLWLVLAPLWLALTPGTLFYAVAHAGLLDATQDATRPVKRWALAATPATLALALAAARWTPASTSDRVGLAWSLTGAAVTLATAMLFHFAGTARTPTRRMAREHTGPWRALLPAGRIPSLRFAWLYGALTVALSTALFAAGSPAMRALTAWTAAFLGALSGLMALRGARDDESSGAARLHGVVALFVTGVGLWLVALLQQLGGGTHPDLLAHPTAPLALSPTWALLAALQAVRPHDVTADTMRALWTGAGLYAAAALVLHALASRRGRT